MPELNRTHADVNYEGAFHIVASSPGTYTLTVVDQFGTAIVSQPVQDNERAHFSESSRNEAGNARQRNRFDRPLAT